MQPTIGLKRIERFVDARTLRSRADRATERGAGKSQKDPGTYANQRVTLCRELRQRFKAKRNTVIALRGNPRGVLHHSCLAKAFGDASYKT